MGGKSIKDLCFSVIRIINGPLYNVINARLLLLQPYHRPRSQNDDVYQILWIIIIKGFAGNQWTGLGRDKQAAGCDHMLPLLTCTNRIAVVVQQACQFASFLFVLGNESWIEEPSSSSWSFLLNFPLCWLSLDEMYIFATFADAQKLYVMRISEFFKRPSTLFFSSVSFSDWELVIAN